MENAVNTLRLSRKDKEKEQCLVQYNLQKDYVKLLLEKWDNINVSSFLQVITEIDPVKGLQELEWMVYDFIVYISWKTANNDGDQNLYESAREDLLHSSKRIYARLIQAGIENNSELMDILNQVVSIFTSLQSLMDLPNTEDINKFKKRIISLLAKTIELNTRQDLPLESQFFANEGESDRGLLLEELNGILTATFDYIEHILVLAQDRGKDSEVQWIFHLNWGIKMLDDLSESIISKQAELEIFKRQEKDYLDIQLAVSDLHETFRLLDAPEILTVLNENCTEEELSICIGKLYECQDRIRERIEKLEENIVDLEEGEDSN